MDKKILILLFLVSGFAFSQTTVTLQDQCNCEVLSGTAVTSPGTTTPTGADTGDIYVNTNTGVIYFWDGDTWELTSSDDQVLQNFSFNPATNILSLDIEAGNTVSVDLSALSNAGTDDQVISLSGNILTLEDGGTVDLTPFLDNTDNQQITTFSIDAGNILTLTLENGNTQTVDLSGLLGTDDQTAAEVTYDNTVSGLTATDVQAAIDEINAAAGTVALVDNGDGTYDFTDAAGNTTTITDTSISTLVDNTDGTYTYTDETGATQVINTNASSNPYDNTVSGLTATDVQAAIDEINAAAGTVALVDNGDGTYDFTDAAGNTTTITDTSISTLVDNTDGTYTYTDETGATQVINTNASSNPYDNTVSGLTATDVQAAIDEINAAAGTVALVDNGDGTYDFTDAAGNTTTITDTSISTLVDNTDGTYTYTDETGATQVINTNASSNPYDNTVSGLTATDVQAAIDEINAAAGTVALVDNGDGTYDFTDAAGNTTTITDTSISTLVDNTDGTYTYTDETGATQVINTNASSNPYDNTVSGLTATDVQAAIDEINAAAGTVALVDNGDGTYDFTDAAGNTTTITDTSISTLVDNTDGTYTYTDETGATQVINTNASSNPYDNTVSGLTATDVQAAIDEINAAAGTVALVDNGDGTYDFTDAAGNTTTITDTSISTLVDNLDGTYTYTDETGATQVINTNASSNPYDNTVSGLTATDVQAAIDEINAAAGTVALVDNADGTYTFTDAGGNVTTISDTSISTIVDNLDGTYTYTDETGATQVINTNASSNPYDNTTSGLVATDVQAAIDEINAAAGTVALVDNGDGTYDFTDAAGNTTTITDTSISTLVDNTDGTYTYTDETGATQVINTNASSNPYDNTVSGLTATDVQAAIDEINAAAGTVALVDNGDGTYDFTDAAGNTTTITDTSISTLVDNTDGTYTYTDETGATQLINTNASSNPYDNTVSGLTATDVQAAIDEINAAAGTVALVDNGDGTYDFTDAVGNTTTITDTSISTLVDNLDGTYTYTDETGATQVINTNASSNPYDNTVSGLTATDVQAAIDEINAAAGTVALVDNADGTYTFTDAGGNVTTISDTSISTLVNNGDATFTYTDETGTPVTIDLISADVNNDIIAGSDGGLYLNVASVTVAETITNLNDNGDGTFTYTNENGTPQTVNKSDITDNGNGTYTFDNNDGTPVTISTTAGSNPYDNTTSGLTATDVQAAIDEVAAGSTDDQNLNLAANTLSIEDGNSVDLTPYLDNTDDQNISGSGLSGTDLTIGIENGTSEIIDLSSLVGTDDQNIAGSGLSGTDLTIGIENGTSEIIDLSSLVGTDDQTAAEVTYDNTTSGLTATEVQSAIDEVAAGSTDDQNISGSGLSGTDLTIGIENGTSEVIDLSSLVGTDDQNISGSGLSGTDLTIGIENGTSEIIDLSSLVGTDDQTAAEVTYDNTTSGLTATEVQSAIDEVAAGSTDDQNISGSGLSGTDLTIGIENGASEVIDLSSLVGTDDQNLSTDSTPGNISIEDGNAITLNVDDADADATNEYNTGVGMNAGALEVTDNGGTLSTSLISTDANNDISSGSDGALYLNVASVTISETITNLADNGDGTFTYTNENGTPQTVNKSDITDNGNGTYTFDNNDGTPVIISTTAGSNPYDNTTSGLTATDVQAAIDEVAAGSTDDQNISGSGLSGTDLTIGIENGTSEIIDLSSLVGTDDQNISGSGLSGTDLTIGIENGTSEVIDLSSLVGTDDQTAAEVTYDNTTSGLTATEVQSAIDEVAAGSTDDQNIAGSGLSGTDLTIGIENGAAQVVDLSSLVGTDDQTAAEVTYDNTTSGLAATEVQSAIDEVAAGSTDDQNIAGSGLSGTDLTIGIENGTSEVIDLSSLVGTDDQNISGSGLSGTDLTIAIENGASEVIDLSSLVGTDDQTAAEVTYDNTTSGLTATEVQSAIDEVAAGSTDDQNIAGSGLSGTDLTIGIENGAAQVVDLSSLVGTDDQTAAEVTYDNTTSGLTATEVQSAIDEVAAGSTDDQNIAGSGLSGTDLTIGIENGAAQVVDLSSLVGTDDQNLNLAANTLSIEDGNSVDLTPYLDNTDDQNISGSGLSGTDLTIGIENGTSEIIDLSSLVGTDDQTAAEVTYDNTTSGLTATEVQSAIDEVAAGSTDDQNISGSGLSGTDLTIGIENGASEVIDLSSLVGTDDQNLSTDSTPGNISIEDGNAITLNVDDADADPTNEYNTGVGMNAGALEVTDNGGTLSTSLISTDANNDISSGSDGALYLNVSSVTISETITNLADNGDGTFTYTNENGVPQSVSKAEVTDNGNGTYTFDNNDGTPVTISTTAATNPYDNTTSGLTATNVQAAIDEVATGSTDDQNIAGSGLSGTDLTIGIENGAAQVVDLSSLVGTDDQNLNLAANTLSIEDGNSVDLTPYLDNTDDQNISGSGLSGTDLTIGIENGTSEIIDLSSLLGTDDQTAAEVTYDNTTSGLTATEVQSAIDEVAAGSTDDQNISGSGLSGTDLTIGIENGTSEVIDLSSLVGTDDQNISGSGLSGTDLTIAIENGASEVIDLSSLVGTDDQTAAEVTYDNTTSGLTATEVQAAIDEVAAGSTDDQNIAGSGLSGTDLTIGIENGAAQVVDLSSLVGTDDQNLNLAANTLSIEDGNSVDLTPYLDNTDDQNISGSGLSGTDLTIGIENGTSEIIDLSSLVGTDDQNISGSGLSGTDLTIAIENGASEVIDLSSLVGTDDQTAAEVTYDNTTSGLTATEVQSAIDEVAAGSTDDQNLNLAANTLSIEDGNSVDLTPYLDNTDDQNISGSGLSGTDLTIGIENGTSEIIDLSSLVGTDDQTAAEVTYDNTTSGLTATEVQSAIDEVAAGSTDDQNLNLAANTLSIEDGNSVDLTPYLDNTDDQNISGSGLSGTDLTIGIENGAPEVIDLSSLVGTDDQNISGSGLSGTDLTIAIENGASEVIDLSSLVGTDDQTAAEVTYDNTTSGLTATEVQSAIDEVAAGSTDDQNLNLAANTLSIEDGNSVDLTPYLDNTDDQNISGSGLSGTDLTIGIENGTSEIIDLSSLVGTDDQNISGSGLSGTDLTIAIENGASEVIDLSSLVGTDDQTAAEVTYDNTTSGLTATEVQSAIDEVAAGSTDDQNLNLAANTLSIEDGNSVDLTPYLDNTDDQNISGSGLSGTDLTIGIENGTSETIDLSSLVGTDDQTAAEVTYDNTTSGLTATEVQSAIDEVAAGSTDDQNLNLAANTLSIEDGNSVDLTPYLDNTDDQNISGSGLSGTDLTIGIENGTSEVIDLSSLVGTDDQNISGSGLSGTDLTIGIENGTSEIIDLSSLVGTDDQTAAEVTYDNTTSGLTATEVQSAIDEVAAGSTDDQNISGSGLSGTDLTIGIENGTSETIDLSSLVGTDDQTAAEVTYDNTTSGLTATEVQSAIDEVAAGSTDDQNISGSGLSGTDLTIGIENGAAQVVDLSSLVGTDDQTAAEVTYDNTTSGLTATEVQSAIDEVAAGSTDDQNISGSGLSGTDLTIGIENGAAQVVDLSSLVGTDDQNIENLAIDLGTNILTVGIEDGTSQTVDLSHLDDSGTDDQTAAEVTYDNTTSGLTATEVQAAIDEVAAGSTDDQYDDEVLLRTPIDVDEGGEAAPTAETNVQEVINAIAPITSKAARIFYPPSIAIDASTNGTGYTVDLYAQYIAQFGTPAVASAGAPAAVPTYTATELYYYVTYADPTVFANMSIDANGVLTYDIVGQPTDYNSLINVVFVVK